jgi:5-aminolevulinate synthase
MNYNKFINSEISNFKVKGFSRRFTPIYRYQESFPFSKVEFENTSNSPQVLPDANTQIWCSNDYLNMSHHPKVIDEMISVIKKVGTGSGGTRNISGTTPYHNELEKKLADFHEREKALVFTSAYVANQSTISTLCKKIKNIHVFSDELNHASLIEGIQNSKANYSIFRHNDLTHLEELLKAYEYDQPKIIIFESLYSMDGTETNVAEYVKLAKKYNALTYLDEVHAVGLYGKGGRGVAFKNNVSENVDIINGTLAKGFGQIGGYIVGNENLIEFIRCFTPGFIFTTSIMPSIAAAASASIDIVEKSDELRKNIFSKAIYLRLKLKEIGIPFINSNSHIVPLLVYKTEIAKRFSKKLLEEYNCYVQPIFYPTVPKESARLRITITPKHSYTDIDNLVIAIQNIWLKEHKTSLKHKLNSVAI